MNGEQLFYFGCGALVCWVVLGAFGLLGNTLHWECDDRFWIALCFPVLAVVAPLIVAGYMICHPWQNVWRPVPRARWEEASKDFRKLRITNRFYICFDRKASRIWNIIFFVRIQKEKNPFDRRTAIQKLFGFCPHCGKWFRRVRTAPQHTEYEDPASNYFTGCRECEEENDAYWEERWAEYNASRL